MFKKINCSLSNLNADLLKGELFEDHKTFVMFEIKDFDYLNSVISKSLTFTIEPSKISYVEIAERGLRPHTDGYVGCSLNHVLDDTESHTVFWSKISSSPRISNLKKTSDGKVVKTETTGFNYKDLEYVCSFSSTKNDTYLIDVREIHSVERYKKIFKRKLLSIRWDPKYTLEEIYESISVL